MHYLNIQASGRDASRSNPNQEKILSSRKKLFPAAHFYINFKEKRRGGDQPCCQFVVKMLSKPRTGEKMSPFMRTQDAKKPEFSGFFDGTSSDN